MTGHTYRLALALVLALAGCSSSPLPAPVFLPSPSLPTPTFTPVATAAPRLAVHLDIRDGVTGSPVEADVWYTVDAGDDQPAAAGVTQTEFDLPPGEIIVKVEAPGYRLWWVQIHQWQRGERDQVLPISVKLEPLK